SCFDPSDCQSGVCTADGICGKGAPREFIASTDDEYAVHLSWLPPLTEETPIHYELTRNGSVIGYVGYDILTYDDIEALGGSIQPPQALRATLATRIDGVLLEWDAAVAKAGAVSVYEVVAVYADNTRAISSSASGNRAAPKISYEVSSDNGVN
ncbi:MAG: hypothetical protein JW841_05445, partial [Deltaproteobacteria bacterium]|nr:hypothetical protein [Deltaproteobacteria bacterium]